MGASDQDARIGEEAASAGSDVGSDVDSDDQDGPTAVPPVVTLSLVSFLSFSVPADVSGVLLLTRSSPTNWAEDGGVEDGWSFTHTHAQGNHATTPYKRKWQRQEEIDSLSRMGGRERESTSEK